MRCVALLLLSILVLIASEDGSGVHGARTVAEERALAKAKMARANSKHFAQPDYALYHRSDVLLEQVRALVDRHPDKLTREVQQLELNGYSAELHSVTVATGEPNYAANGTDLRIRALLDFGQHGREPITCEVALRLLQLLVGEYPLETGTERALGQLLPYLVIKIVPMENLKGRRQVEAGDLCERKNGRGVDTNRNWSVDWGKKEKDYDPREEYPGTGPFSEPETELLRKLASEFNPHLWVNVHSGMEALFMPYDHRQGTPGDGSALPMAALLRGVNERHLHNKCVVGSGGSSVGYLAHGTATDWMYEELHVPMAFTFEIYGDSTAHDNDCFRMFNPTTRDAFEIEE